VIWNPASRRELESTWNAARSLGVEVKSLEVRAADFYKGSRPSRERVQAVIVVSSRLMSLTGTNPRLRSQKSLFSFLLSWAAEALASLRSPLDSWFDRAAFILD